MDGVCTRFARSYAAARRKFILAAELAGHEVTTHAHTLRGPGGEELANDTVWIGDPDARLGFAYAPNRAFPGGSAESPHARRLRDAVYACLGGGT